MNRVKAGVVFLVCTLSALLWWLQAVQSPLFDKEARESRKYLQTMHEKLSPDLQEQRQLAVDYWLRYEDVRKHFLWGEKGRLGIKGPADHYRTHGKEEGRIYALIARPDDMAKEERLAKAYWQRNPNVARSKIWGKNSPMGILGPRDHYRFYGMREGLKWGE
jgi:hypothetical protein